MITAGAASALDAAPGKDEPLVYASLLRQPTTLALWIGQLASAAGNRLYDMAELWLVYQLTGSTAMMSLVAVAGYVSVAVVGFFGGAWIDRVDRLRLVLALDLIRGALVAALPLLYLTGHMTPWTLVAFGLALSSMGALFAPALQASLPSLVTASALRGLTGLMDLTERLARVLGPGFAGLLLSFIPIVHFFTLDALSFFVSACGFAWILRTVGATARGEAGARGGGARQPLRWRELAEGWALAWRDPVLRVAFPVRGLVNLAWGFYTLGAPLLVDRRFHDDAGAWGLLIAAYGVGNLLGNFAGGNLGWGRHPLKAYLLAVAVMGAGFVGLGLAPSLPVALAAVAFAGVGGPVSHIVIDGYVGAALPGASLGRVFAVQRFIIHAAGAVGLLLAGQALRAWHPGAGIAVAGGFMIVLAAAARATVRGPRPLSRAASAA